MSWNDSRSDRPFAAGGEGAVAARIVEQVNFARTAHPRPGPLGQELERVERGLQTLEQLAGNRRAVVGQLREMLSSMKAPEGSRPISIDEGEHDVG